jgi:hypothetical protein
MIYGESAGAISISLLMLNQTQDLFRGAVSAGSEACSHQIMESGAQSSAPLGPANTTWQAPYNYMVTSVGCNITTAANGTALGATARTSNTSLIPTSSFNCLKNQSATALLNASIAVKGQLQWALP